MRTIRTAMDAMEEIKSVLDDSNLIASLELTGIIDIGNRILNSTKEDIIINQTVFTATQIQRGFFNVNIHLPNLKGEKSEDPTMLDNTQPDKERFKEVGRAVVDTLNDVWLYSSDFSLDNAGELIPDGKDWFLNVRIKYKALRMDVI